MLGLPTPPASPGPVDSLRKPEDRLGSLLVDRIELTAILGVGAYGTVYKARDIETNAEYAVKALNKVGLDQRQRSFQEREIQLHYLANQHDNVVSLVKVLDSEDCTFVVLEYCPEGDLFAKITEEGHYTGDDFKAKCVFLQILDAVRYCHSKGVYHRDLKPENILVKDNGWTVKLADFGLATQDRLSSDFGCGSTFYMSPECQTPNPQPYACYASAANDIWSLGVILVNLTCGRNPWKRASMDDSTFRAYMRDRNFLRTILPVSDHINYILQRIFEVDPTQRITLSELRELVVCCTSLTQGSSTYNSMPTPTRSIDNTKTGSSYAAVGEIPPMEPLPGQQFPLDTIQQFSSVAFSMPPTPAHSNGNGPQHTTYNYSHKQAAGATAVPHSPQNGFVSAMPSWPRYGQFISQLNNIPRNACFWNNLPLY